MKKHIVGENGLGYALGEDGMYYPDLTLPENTNYPIGRYGRMRKEYQAQQLACQMENGI